MNYRVLSFLSLSFVILSFIIIGKALNYLSLDRSVAGVLSNIGLSALTLAGSALLIRFILNLLPIKPKITFRESLVDAHVLLWGTIFTFYGFVIAVFNWPYNPDRTTPEVIESPILTFFLGTGFILIASALWVAFAIRLLVGKNERRNESV